MKQTLLSLALALISPLAFAQTNPGNGDTENPVDPNLEAATNSTDGLGNGETENPVDPNLEAATNSTDGPGNGETENPATPWFEATTTSTDGPGNGETENPVTPKTEAATTTTDGSVAAFALDEMIAVITDEGESMNFGISTAAIYLDKAGNDIDASAIKEGSKVQVTAEENGDQMVASRIVVDS